MKGTLIAAALVLAIGTAVFGFVLQDKKGNYGCPECPTPQPIKDENLEKMIGTWVGKGSQMGSDVSSTSCYSWVLDKQFMQVNYNMETVDGKFKYNGIGFFRPSEKGKYTMSWFDNQGYQYSGESKLKDGLLVCEFSCNSKETKMNFKMETKFDDKGYTETMFMKQGKEWSEMGKISFTKKEEKKDRNEK